MSKTLIFSLFFKQSELINRFVSQKSKNTRIVGWKRRRQNRKNRHGQEFGRKGQAMTKICTGNF